MLHITQTIEAAKECIISVCLVSEVQLSQLSRINKNTKLEQIKVSMPLPISAVPP